MALTRSSPVFPSNRGKASAAASSPARAAPGASTSRRYAPMKSARRVQPPTLLRYDPLGGRVSRCANYALFVLDYFFIGTPAVANSFAGLEGRLPEALEALNVSRHWLASRLAPPAAKAHVRRRLASGSRRKKRPIIALFPVGGPLAASAYAISAGRSHETRHHPR
mgnify:CR=1 FL=1